jgi:hypothetical protein
MSISKEMAREILAFVDSHPDGWSDDDWFGFLHHLGASGLDISDPDVIGLALERARVQTVLKAAGVKGLGPKRVESIATEFSFLPQLKDTDPDEVASRTGVPKKLVHEALTKIAT